MERPHCKKPIEVTIVEAAPWWKNPGCLFASGLLILFVIYGLFFAERRQATREVAARLEERLQKIEQMVGQINQKLDREPQEP